MFARVMFQSDRCTTSAAGYSLSNRKSCHGLCAVRYHLPPIFSLAHSQARVPHHPPSTPGCHTPGAANRHLAWYPYTPQRCGQPRRGETHHELYILVELLGSFPRISAEGSVLQAGLSEAKLASQKGVWAQKLARQQIMTQVDLLREIAQQNRRTAEVERGAESVEYSWVRTRGHSRLVLIAVVMYPMRSSCQGHTFSSFTQYRNYRCEISTFNSPAERLTIFCKSEAV